MNHRVTTTTTKATTTTPYVYRNTISPPTVDTMLPISTMCGVLLTSGQLAQTSSCVCDPPRNQLNKRFKFTYPWNRNLSDPSTADFKSAKLAFEEQVILPKNCTFGCTIRVSRTSPFYDGFSCHKILLNRSSQQCDQ